ncbi:MAG: hypothetical protein ACXV8Q_00410 [Methylobacter sp.]
MSHDLLYWHNKGEQDYPDYDPPHGTLAETIPLPGFPDSDKKAREENEAYIEGFQNARRQAEE